MRGRGGYGGRGRGGYGGSFDGSMSNAGDPYDQVHPQGDMGASYNNYEAQPGPQNSYYQNNYGAPAPFPPGPPAPAFNPGFVKYEGALET